MSSRKTDDVEMCRHVFHQRHHLQQHVVDVVPDMDVDVAVVVVDAVAVVVVYMHCCPHDMVYDDNANLHEVSRVLDWSFVVMEMEMAQLVENMRWRLHHCRSLNSWN